MKFDWIVNKLKERIYPYTHADAVIMDDDGTKLPVVIEEINERIDNIGEIGAVQSDWSQTSPTNPSFIKNKPTSLPANGGNADTLDNKHVSDFASTSDFNTHVEDTTVHVPTGGSVGQVLTKMENGNDWTTVTGGDGYVHPSYTAHTNGLYKITVNSTGHVSDVSTVTKSDITVLGIPGSDTNTTYSVATQLEDGLMSREDKVKLDNYPSNLPIYPNIIFSDTVPETLEDNTICFVYEEL